MDDCVEVELEGGGWYWFLVCGECHGVLTGNEKECPNCKKPIKKQATSKNKNEICKHYYGEASLKD